MKGLMSQVGGDSLSSPSFYQISRVFEVFDPSLPKAFKQKTSLNFQRSLLNDF